MSSCNFVLESDGNYRTSIALLRRKQFNHLTVQYSSNYMRDNFAVMYAIFWHTLRVLPASNLGPRFSVHAKLIEIGL